MADTAGAGASAHNAQTVVAASTPELVAELARRQEQYEAEAPARLIANLEARVARQKAFLAQAEQLLADAKAAAREGTN